MITGFTTIVVTDEQGTELEPNHYCESRELKMYCDRLSSTSLTCYPNELRIGYKRCSEGWKEIPIIEIITPEQRISTNQNKLHCTQDGCF